MFAEVVNPEHHIIDVDDGGGGGGGGAVYIAFYSTCHW
jgi:hypothetical protein